MDTPKNRILIVDDQPAKVVRTIINKLPMGSSKG